VGAQTAAKRTLLLLHGTRVPGAHGAFLRAPNRR
jgi:hypothetical protein